MGARSLPAPPGSQRDEPQGGGPPPDGAARPGPLTLPPGHRPRDPRWAWGVSVAVVILGLVLYAIVHSGGGGSNPLVATPPSWGPLTLRQVAIATGRATGGRRPRSASWLSAQRGQALEALGLPQTAGTPSANPAEADYVLILTGDFRGPGERPLPGSAASGPYLVAFVRGFDGHVTATLVSATNPAPALAHAGLLHPLPVGRFRL